MKRLALLFLFAAGTVAGLYAQSWRIHLNTNEIYPVGNEVKGYYPMLWYSSTEGRGVLLGGFGGGVSYARPLWGLQEMRFQLNVQRSRFYDLPVLFSDDNGQSLGGYIGINTNINTGVLCMPVFDLYRSLYLGAGLSARTTVWSRTNYGTFPIQGIVTELKMRNRSHAPVVAGVPVELGIRWKHFGVAARVEFGVTPESRLEGYKKERAFVSVLEGSYRF